MYVFSYMKLRFPILQKHEFPHIHFHFFLFCLFISYCRVLKG